jgi:hypothetical protein
LRLGFQATVVLNTAHVLMSGLWVMNLAGL